MGPVTLCDEVGLDVAVHVAATLNADPTLAPRMGGAEGNAADGGDNLMEALVAAGVLGRKNGQGFFLYPKGKGKKAASKKRELNPAALAVVKAHVTAGGDERPKPSEEDIQHRMARPRQKDFPEQHFHTH